MINFLDESKIYVSLVAVALIISIIDCDSGQKMAAHLIPIQPVSDAVDPDLIRANTQFGFNLFDEIRKTDQGKNIFISPFSISVALAMTLNGAAEETEQAMTNTLQLQRLDSEAINIGYDGLRQTLLTADPKVTLTIANSLWARQDIPFKQDFLQRNIQFFGAEISTLDFNDPSAPETINQWVDTNTKGKIQKIVDDKIDPLTMLFLINAIYFKGTWQEEFDPSETREGPFHLANGDVRQVPMMRQQRRYPYYRGENFQAIRLAYGDGQMSMYIFLPDGESNLNSFLENLNAESWESWMLQFHEQDVSLVMPKFKLEYKKELKDTLKALGMGIAFGQGATFSRMSPLGRDFFIKEVLHKTFVEVNEEGTEAAAVTGVIVRKESVPPPIPFTIDRPFFFAIRDNQTGTVLFMGVVVDPTTVKETPFIPEPPIILPEPLIPPAPDLEPF